MHEQAHHLLRVCAAHDATLAGDEKIDEVADAVYGARGGALYKFQSKMNHSCMPNARLLCSFTDASIDVVACADVPAGTEVLISYVNPASDRAHRQRVLRASYGFACTCAACAGGAAEPAAARLEVT